MFYRVICIANASVFCYTTSARQPDLVREMKKSASKESKEESPKKAATTSVKKKAAKKSTGGSNTSSPRWTFLTNHTHVLAVLHANPESILRQVAIDVGITERAVQRIVQDLEDNGFIRRERVGRRNKYHVLTGQQLRHPVESHRTIGDLLKLINK